MTDAESGESGKFAWFDLTVPDAEGVRDFYKEVVGWTSENVDVGGYNDFNMQLPGSGTTVAGICHQQGENADLPPVWMVYITVADVNASADKAVELGGTLVRPVMGEPGPGQFCIIRDPAGAHFALMNS